MLGFFIPLCIVSIIFFIPSLRACKEFLQKKDPSMFPDVKSKGDVAWVLFAITCTGFVLFVMIIVFAANWQPFFGAGGVYSYSNKWGSVISGCIVDIIVFIVTFVIGIMALKKSKEAQKAYNAIAPKPSGAVGGSNAAVPFGNTPNNNGANYADPNNTANAGTGYNAGNASNTGVQGGYEEQ